MEKNNKKYIIIIGIILIYILIKCFLAYSLYDTKRLWSDDIYDINLLSDSLVVKHEELDDSEYIQVNDIKIKNYFENFKYDEKRNVYIKYDDNGKVLSHFIVDNFSSIPQFEEDSDEYKYLKKHNINDSIDYTKFVANYELVKNTIFTPIWKIKDNYLECEIVQMSGRTPGEYQIIEGDLKGVLISTDMGENRNLYVLYLNNESKSYSLNFTNGNKDNAFFNDKVIKDILNTLKYVE